MAEVCHSYKECNYINYSFGEPSGNIIDSIIQREASNCLGGVMFVLLVTTEPSVLVFTVSYRLLLLERPDMASRSRQTGLSTRTLPP